MRGKRHVRLREKAFLASSCKILHSSIGYKRLEEKSLAACSAPTRPLSPLAATLEFILIAEGKFQPNATCLLEAIFTTCCNLAHVMNNSDNFNSNLKHQEALNWQKAKVRPCFKISVVIFIDL